MDIIYIFALLIFIVLVCILIVSIRNLVRLKKELRKIMELNEDTDGTKPHIDHRS